MDEPSVATRIADWLWALPAAFAAVLYRMLNGKAGKETLDRLAESFNAHIAEDREFHTRVIERMDQTNIKLAELVGEFRGRDMRPPMTNN